MIPPALKNLFGSEKAFAGGVLVIASTVMVFMNRMTVAEWQEFCTWIFGIYAAGKTATGVAASFAPATSAPVEAAPAVVATPVAATPVVSTIVSGEVATEVK